MRFKYIERGKKDVLVLIPGWASDWRIFSPLNLEFNYLMPLDFSPFTFQQDLLPALKENNIKQVSVFGWSLGGFVGAEFAARHPGLIEEIILVSIRKRYKNEQLRELKGRLAKNKKAALHKFYARCFARQSQMRWFRENLLKSYCHSLDLDCLLEGLDYLAQAQIQPELLNNIKRIKIIHGERDLIAPLQEAMEIKQNSTQARFIGIKNAGHIPFLGKDFHNLI